MTLVARAAPGTLVCVALAVAGCGRVGYAPDAGRDAAEDAASPGDVGAEGDAPVAPDAAVPVDAPTLVDAQSPFDATRLDAPSSSDAPSAPDATDPDAFVPPDAASPVRFVVTHGGAAGPGSLTDAITAANATCPPGARIEFDVPPTDPRFDPRGFVRIATPAAGAYTITCAGLAVDGGSQTLARGDTNPATLGGALRVGLVNAPLAAIPGPEVALANTIVDVMADDVVLHGIAFTSLGAHASGLTVEDCVIGSEPTLLTPELGRTHLWGAYIDGTATTLRRVAMMGGVALTTENLVVLHGGVTTLEDVALVPGPTTAAIYDTLHVRAAATVTVSRSFIDAGATYETAMEVSAGASVTVVASTVRGGTGHATRFGGASTGEFEASRLTGAVSAALVVSAGSRVTLDDSVFGDSGGAAIDLAGATESPSPTDCGYESAGSSGIDRPELARGGGGVLLASGCPGATVTVGVADPSRGDELGGELVASPVGAPLYTMTLDAAGRATGLGLVPPWIATETLVAYQTDALGNTSMLSANLAP